MVEEKMFCYQCQEASKGTGCTIKGICGKGPEVANLQNLFIYVIKGLSYWTTLGRKHGLKYPYASHLIIKGLFATITNANFDERWFIDKIEEVVYLKDEIKSEVLQKIETPSDFPEAAMWGMDVDFEDRASLIAKGLSVGPTWIENEDKRSLVELIFYGVKGLAAYADHAYVLGYEDQDIYAFIESALSQTLNQNASVDELVVLTDKTGEYGVKVMALLDKANTETFGNPEPTEVSLGVGNRPGILVSGHDLLDLKELLEQTEEEGVDVYTHGEMLPAHAYPELKKFEHLKGNYGGSWWHQAKEFDSFNGPILLTTNCLIPPKDSYIDRLFVTGNVGWPNVKRIGERPDGGQKDFSKIIEIAKQSQPPKSLEKGTVTVGFAHNTVLSVADKVIDAIKTGALKRFVVMAGCDGRFKDRNYYEEVAKMLPDDTIILTAGCAKYRYNKLDLGDIEGIPRVLDAGQCNDSYSLAVVALKLAEVFEKESVNELPLSFDIAWYEQKAVIVLLALLHLGVKKIRLGPTLPAFLNENITNVLVDKFGLKPISTAERDVEAMLQGN